MNLFSVCGQILVSVKPIGIDKFILDMYEVHLSHMGQPIPENDLSHLETLASTNESL